MSSNGQMATIGALRRRRGFALIDAILTMFLLAIAGLVFSAAMPTATSCARQAEEYKTASALASQKMEQLRSLKYELLTSQLLYTNRVIDSSTSDSHYTLTNTDQVATKLTRGKGTLSVTDIASDIKCATVTVSWVSSYRAVPRSVRLTSYIVDRRTRKAN